MTAEELIHNLTELNGIVNGDLADHTLMISGSELLIQIKQRIFYNGLNSDERPIGNYSTKPMYASPRVFLKQGSFKPQGKHVVQSKGKYKGQTVGDVRISKYLFKDSLTVPKKRRAEYIRKRFNYNRDYKNFLLVKSSGNVRRTMYLPGGYKQLREVQGLPTDIVNLNYSGQLRHSYQIQKQDSMTVLLGLTNQLSSLKRSGMERKYGTIFTASQNELQRYIDRSTYLLNRLVLNTIEGYHVETAIEQY